MSNANVVVLNANVVPNENVVPNVAGGRGDDGSAIDRGRGRGRGRERWKRQSRVRRACWTDIAWCGRKIG